MNARILVVDDELGMREGCRRVLTAEGYDVQIAEDGPAGLDLFRAQPGFAAALVDLKMPRMGGLELIEQMRRLDEDVVILVITAYATIDTAVEATKRGAYGYIPKPFTPNELLLPVRNGLERRALALEARRLRQEHERAKATFISLVAHEVRNPLAAVEGFLDAVLGAGPDRLGGEERALIERARLRTRALNDLLRDLLSLSAIETGNFVLRPAPLDLRGVVDEAVRAHRDNAAQKPLRLVWDAPADPPPAVRADADAMRSIVFNLLDNAVKYTPAGGQVSVSLAQDAAGVRITVADTGIGMSEEECARAFDEFFRARNEWTAHIPGTGLGLSLVKRLVAMQGGTVAVQSARGRGSAFTVSLPSTVL